MVDSNIKQEDYLCSDVDWSIKQEVAVPFTYSIYFFISKYSPPLRTHSSRRLHQDSKYLDGSRETMHVAPNLQLLRGRECGKIAILGSQLFSDIGEQPQIT